MATLTIELPANVTQGQMIQALDSLGCELRLASDGRNYKAVPKRQRVRRQSSGAMQKKAAAFRQQYDKVGQGGFVIFFRGQPVAWKRFLDGASSWEPGCIAMDESGTQWITAGGNAKSGALRWDPVAEPPANVTRLPVRGRPIHQPGPGAA